MSYYPTGEDTRLLSAGDLFQNAGVSTYDQRKFHNLANKIFEMVELSPDEKIERMKKAVAEAQAKEKIKGEALEKLVIKKLISNGQTEISVPVYDRNDKLIRIQKRQILNGEMIDVTE